MKAILVMEMPERCDYCPIGRIFGMVGQVECMASKNVRVNQNGKTIPDWCPLVPMPERKQNTCSHGFAGGWNACIDAVEGGKGK